MRTPRGRIGSGRRNENGRRRRRRSRIARGRGSENGRRIERLSGSEKVGTGREPGNETGTRNDQRDVDDPLPPPLDDNDLFLLDDVLPLPRLDELVLLPPHQHIVDVVARLLLPLDDLVRPHHPDASSKPSLDTFHQCPLPSLSTPRSVGHSLLIPRTSDVVQDRDLEKCPRRRRDCDLVLRLPHLDNDTPPDLVRPLRQWIEIVEIVPTPAALKPETEVARPCVARYEILEVRSSREVECRLLSRSCEIGEVFELD